MYTCVHSSITHNSPQLEATRCPSTGGWINKMCCIYNGVLFSCKKEWITDHACIELEIFAQWKKSDSKDHIHVSIYKSKMDKSIKTQSRLISGCQGWGKERIQDGGWLHSGCGLFRKMFWS
jgi:hypothetical protein